MSKLDVIVLSILAAIGLIFIGLVALLRTGTPLPTDLVTIETLLIGVLGGRVMPTLGGAPVALEAVSSAAGATVVQ